MDKSPEFLKTTREGFDELFSSFISGHNFLRKPLFKGTLFFVRVCVRVGEIKGGDFVHHTKKKEGILSL